MICLKEVLLADRMTKEGKTASQIREAIIKGEWQTAKFPELPER